MLIEFRTKDGRQGLFDRWNIRPKGILHVGANIGEEAPVYDELGIPSALFIEANPDIYEKLEANLLPFYNKGRDYTADCYCVSDTEGEEVMFHVSNNGSQSSSILELGTHKIQHPEVHYVNHIKMKTTRLDTHIPENLGYDFLNMDLQGAELKALHGMGDLLKKFKWLYLEVNRESLYIGCGLIDDIDFYVSQYGFRRVETKWVGGWGDSLFIRDLG